MLGKVVFDAVVVEEGDVHAEQERELHGPSRRHVRTRPTIYPDCLLTLRSATLAVKMLEKVRQDRLGTAAEN